MLRTLIRYLPLRWLPISDYWKTRIWAASSPRPTGLTAAQPYHRCVELATRGFATPSGYGTAFPGAGNPLSSYTMLEFGVAGGRTLQLMLHLRDVWLRRMNLENHVFVLGFDTFEGLPEERTGDTSAPWRSGDFHGDELEIQRYLEQMGFADFTLVKGPFSDTLPARIDLLRASPPVFVSVDCDYYSSTIDVLDVLLPDIAPHGCMFYFDDVSIDFYSDLTGELKAIAEVNRGRYGPHIQLVHYPLWIETREIRHYCQVYRLVNTEKAEAQRAAMPVRPIQPAPHRGPISPADTN
jgi:hypothetical protein